MRFSACAFVPAKEKRPWGLSQVQDGTVLDIGCIDVRHPERFASSLHAMIRGANPNVVGMDADVAAVETCRKLGFRVELGDAQFTPLGGPYDVVVAGELIEHLDNPGSFLQNARSSLAAGGNHAQSVLHQAGRPHPPSRRAPGARGAPDVVRPTDALAAPERERLRRGDVGVETLVWFGGRRGLGRVFARVRRYFASRFGVVARPRVDRADVGRRD